MLPQLQPGFKADGIDHKVGVDVGSVAVGGHQHLVSWPCLRRKLQPQFVSLSVGDVLHGREGLYILVKKNTTLFMPCGTGGFKLCDGIQAVAMDSGDPTLTVCFVPCFLFLHAVVHHPLHIAGSLPGFFDIGDGRQLNHPVRCAGLLRRWPAAVR